MAGLVERPVLVRLDNLESIASQLESLAYCLAQDRGSIEGNFKQESQYHSFGSTFNHVCRLYGIALPQEVGQEVSFRIGNSTGVFIKAVQGTYTDNPIVYTYTVRKI